MKVDSHGQTKVLTPDEIGKSFAALAGDRL
jgi:hypothetical protein